MIRSHLIGTCSLVLVLFVGGCARQRNAVDSKIIYLHVSDWGGASADPRYNRIQDEITAEWNRRHPNIRIVPEHIPGSSAYVSKVLTEFVAGIPPDVMQLDDASAASFIDNNTLVDLTPFIQKEHFNLLKYYPNVLDIARRGRRLYALPSDFTPMMMYYNKKFFREAGLQYPRDGWTWNDFLRDAQKLTVWSKGAYQPTRYAFLAENWMPGWIVWIWQNGGDVLSPNGQTASGYMDSPATIQAVRFFADLEKNHLAPNLSASQAQGEDPFASGLVAMTISGHWDLVPLRASETISMNDVGVVGLPRNKRRVTVIYESGYAITKGCKHPHAAWEYVKFMCGDYVQRMKAKLGIGISAIKSVAESHRNSNPLEPEFLENIKYGVAPWGTRVENYDVIEDIGAEMMDEVLIGHVPPEQALKTATSRANAELESNE